MTRPAHGGIRTRQAVERGAATRAGTGLSGRPRSFTVAIAGFVGVGALFGSYGLLSDAEGLGAKESWLDGTPFPDYKVPAIVLLVIIGGGMLVTAAAALRRSRFAAPASLAMGLTLLAWGAVETITIGYRGAPQVVLLGLFVVGPALPLIKIGSDAGAWPLIRRAVWR